MSFFHREIQTLSYEGSVAMRRYQWIRWRKFILWLTAIVLFGGLLWAGGPTYWGIALSIASLLMQLVFAMAFMIIQFVALFWFLARGRTYWILPGETGSTWDDYRGILRLWRMRSESLPCLRGSRSSRRWAGKRFADCCSVDRQVPESHT